MQLKRDTDYALRILLCMGEQSLDGDAPAAGLTLPELSARAGVPKISANRICGYLECKNILSKRRENGELLYFPGEALTRQTLLDVLSATEGGAHLFAVFDRKTELYRTYGAQLEAVQKAIEDVLSGVSLADLLSAGR